MFELNKNYRCGGKTFLFLFIAYGWWLSLFGLLLIYLSYEIYFGRLHDTVNVFLAGHPDWYVDIFMISEWILLLGISFVFVAYIRATTVHKSTRFLLDEHAFHLRRGLFFIRETTIPYGQISKVNISRPYHFRMLGVAEFDVITADDRSSRQKKSSSKFLIPVIDTAIAKSLSKQLLEYASMIKHGQDISEDIEEEYDEDNDECVEEGD
jgi:uncharacterized membrane protein YdbT with pleckstrin-like domain